MQTDEFEENLEKLIELAKHHRVALIFAEAVPWRCHRSLIADALIVHHIKVREIVSVKRLKDHELTSFAQVYKKKIIYPAF